MLDDNDANLPKKIKDWLEKQGQSLEMRVAKLFRENGFVVSQFEYFVDEESQIVRQTDIVASISKNIQGSLVTINLIIECKYAKSKPWVILVTQQKFDRYTFFGRLLHSRHPSDWKNLPTLQGRMIGRVALSLERTKAIENFEVNPAGYTVMEARLDTNYRPDPNQQDYAYEAIMQVSRSIEAHDRTNENVFNNMSKTLEDALGVDTGYNTINTSTLPFSLDLSIAFPMVVISGRLFQSQLSNENEIEVSEIEHGIVLTPNKRHETNISYPVPLSSVMIVTENNLKSFIAKAHTMIDSILEQDKAIIEFIDYEEEKLHLTSDQEF